MQLQLRFLAHHSRVNVLTIGDRLAPAAYLGVDSSRIDRARCEAT
jgi:hypothetical protein